MKKGKYVDRHSFYEIITDYIRIDYKRRERERKKKIRTQLIHMNIHKFLNNFDLKQ